MRPLLIAGAAFLVGLALGVLYGEATYRHLRRQVRELKAGKPRFTIQSVTRFIFLTAQVFAIVWVSWSYIIATYATVVLEQPFPAEELSKEAVRTILGVGALKVLENIFEHNEGLVFGKRARADAPTAEPSVEDDDMEGGAG